MNYLSSMEAATSSQPALTAAHRDVLRALSAAQALSRSELASKTGYSRAAITSIARDLITSGLLFESDMVYGQGRPSVRLAINADGGYLIGLSLVEDPAPIVLTDLRGNLRARAAFPRSEDPDTLGQRIRDALPALRDDAGIAPGAVVGIGMAVPGYVDQTQRVCLQSNFMGWQDTPVAERIEAATGIPTYVENDANAVAVCEKLFGQARESADFALFTLGEGIGGALFIGGHLHRGHSGGAGEISHATMDMDGLPCRCGKRGCLTTIASGRAMLNAARRLGLECQQAGDIERLAEQGDEQAIAILHRAGTALGLAISQSVQMTNPERVVIVLQFGAVDGLMHRVVKQTIDATIMPRLATHTRITFETVSADFWARGAAAVAAERFLLCPRQPRETPSS